MWEREKECERKDTGVGDRVRESGRESEDTGVCVRDRSERKGKRQVWERERIEEIQGGRER